MNPLDISGSLDSIKSRYMDELNARGVTLDNEQLERLNSYIMKEHSKSVLPQTAQPTEKAVPRVGSATSGIVGDIARRRGAAPLIDSDSSLLDKVGVALWHGAESYAWGLPGLGLEKAGIEEPYQYEDLTDSERAIAVTAEVGALFIPWGPGGFRGLGKVGQMAVSRLSAKGAIKQGKVATKSIISDLPNMLPKKFRKVSTEAGLTKSLKKNIKKELGRGYRDILGINAGKEASEQAIRNLNIGVNAAAFKALKDAGVKGTPAELSRMATSIRERFMREVIQNKKSVNSISEWLGDIVGGAAPGKFRSALSKYLGMAVQDAFILGTHAGATSYIQAAKHDTEWAPENALQGAMILSATFPLIRRIPGGGVENARQGFRFLLDKYNKTNYKKVASQSGDGSVRYILEMMMNKTGFANRTFTLADGRQMSGLQLKYNAQDLDMNTIFKVLNSIKKDVAKESLARWKGAYIPDFIKSLPRMAIGAAVMNEEAFRMGAFDGMAPEEVLAHMGMAALMTKGRGEWGKPEMEANMIDFNRYHGTMRTLGLRGKTLDNVFNSFQASRDANVILAGPDARPIIDIFNAFHGTSENIPTRRDDGRMSFDPKEHKLVADFAALYNTHLLASSGVDAYKPLYVENLHYKDLENIKEALNAHTFSDGKTIKDLGFRGTQTKLSELFGDHVLNIYAAMYEELRTSAGLGTKGNEKVAVEKDYDGKPIIYVGEILSPKDFNYAEGKDYRPLNQLNVLNQILVEGGAARQKEGLKMHIDNLEDIKGVNVPEIGRILRQYEETLPQKVYDNVNVKLDGAIESNDFLFAVLQGKQAKAIDRIYNMAVERGLKDDVPMDHFLTAFKKLFYKKGTPVSDWENQIEYDGTERHSKIKNESERNAAQERDERDFAHMKGKLGEVNNLKKIDGASGHGQKIKITYEEMRAMYDNYLSVFESFPLNTRMQGVDRVGYEYFFERFSENMDIPEDTYNLFQLALNPEVALLHMNMKNGRIYGKDRAAIKEVLKSEGITSESPYYQETLRRHRALVDELKPVKEIRWRDVIIDESVDGEVQIAKMPTSGDIHSLYESRKVDAVKTLAGESLKALEVLQGDVGLKKYSDQLDKIIDARMSDTTEVADRTSALREISGILDKVLNTKMGEAPHIKDAIIKAKKEVDTLLTRHIEVDRAKFKGLIEQDELTTFGLTIKQLMDSAIVEEGGYRDKIVKITADLFGSAAGGDVTPEMAYRQKGQLMQELTRLLSNRTESASLAELLENYKESFSFRDLESVSIGIQQALARDVTINSETEYHDGARAYKEIVEQRQKRDDIRTPVQIAQDWGLIDAKEPNKVSVGLIDDVSKSNLPGDTLVKSVRKAIDTDPVRNKLKPGQKNKLVRDFAKRDGVVLLHYMLNSKPAKKARLENGHLVYDDKATTISSPSTEFFGRYNAYLFDKTGTLPTGRGDTSRRFLINIEDSVRDIQQHLDNEIFGVKPEDREAGKYRQLPEYLYAEMYEANEYAHDMSGIEGLIKGGFKDKPILMRIGNRAILFDAKAENVKMVEDNFNAWYDRVYAELPTDSEKQKNFAHMWQHMKEASSASHVLELKMSTLFVDEVLHRGLMEEYLDPSVFRNETNRKKYENKLLQRSYITGAGNGQNIRRDVLRFMIKRPSWGGWENIVDDLRHYRDNKVRTQIIADEEVEGLWDSNSPFYVRGVTLRHLTQRATDPNATPEQQENARLFRDKLEADGQLEEKDRVYPSLDSSSIDGVEYVSERLARVLWALKGYTLDEFNGLKPYMFENSDTSTLIAKGYYVFDPAISAQMGDVDILLGESAAKIKGGVSVAGGDIQPLRISNGRNDWLSDLGLLTGPGVGREAKVDIDIESISLGVANIDKTAATRSHSLTNYQTYETIKDVREWQELSELVNKVREIDKNVRNGGNNEIAQFLQEVKRGEGHEFVDGSIGLSLKFIEAGGRMDNPIIKEAIYRFTRGPMLEILRNSASGNSMDSMIAPDVEGELRIPIFTNVERENTQNQQWVPERRVMLELGGTVLPYNMRYQRVDKFDKQTFVFNSGGVDIMAGTVSRRPGYYDVKLEDGIGRLRGTDRLEGGIIRRITDGHRDKVKTLLPEIADIFADGRNVKLGQIYDFIEDLKLNKQAIYGGKSLTIGDADQKFLKKTNFQLVTGGHPIPRVGADVAPLRIEGMGGRIEGDYTDGKLAKINAYDQRVGFQRDNDGDRFYYHHNFGIKLLNKFRGRYAQVTDYPQLPKTQDDINIFGIDANGQAGKINEKVGFGEIQTHIEQQKMNVGSAISIKDALTTLSNSGMSIDIGDGTGKRTMHELGSIDSSQSTSRQRTWLALFRQYVLNQSSVDVFGGTNDVARGGRNALVDAYVFGEAPPGLDRDTARQFGISPSNSLFGSKDSWTIAEKTVVNEVIGMVKQSARVFNDVYDEGGKRQVTDYELRQSYNTLRELYGDEYRLNRMLFEKTFKRAMRGKNPDETLATELINLFYGEGGGSALPSLHKYIISGAKGDLKKTMNDIYRTGRAPRHFKPNKIITFKYGEGNRDRESRIEERLEVSNAGYLLKNMMNKNLFQVSGRHWGSVHSTWRRQIGLVASELIETMDMVKTLTDHRAKGEWSTEAFDDVIGADYIYNQFKLGAPGLDITANQKRGLVKVALETEQRGLRRSLRYQKSDKYRPDTLKIEGMEKRLDNVATAITYIEELGYKDLVKEVKNYRILKSTPPTDRKTGVRNRSDYIKVTDRKVHVYRFRGTAPGDVLWDGKKNTIDWKNLQFVASAKDGDTYRKDPGFTYIEFKNPIAPTSMDAETLRYSYALQYNTIGADPADYIASTQDIDRFTSRVMQLRSLAGSEAGMTRNVFKKNRAESKRVSKLSKSKMQHEITRFMRDFLDLDMGKGISQDNADKFDMALRFIVQPRALEGFYTLRMPDGHHTDIPTYRMSNRLLREMFTWATNNGEVANNAATNLIKSWTNTYNGDTPEVEYHQNLMQRIYKADYYGSNLEAKFIPLAKHVGAGYNDVAVKNFFDSHGNVKYGKKYTMEMLQNAEVYMRDIHKGKLEGGWCKPRVAP